MRVLRQKKNTRKSVLERLAGKLDVTVEERAKAFDEELQLLGNAINPSPAQLRARQRVLDARFSNVARWLKPARTIKGLIPSDDGHHAPQPTKGVVEMMDGDVMQYFTDGSLRHRDPVVKGKATVKRFKRYKQEQRRRGFTISV